MAHPGHWLRLLTSANLDLIQLVQNKIAPLINILNNKFRLFWTFGGQPELVECETRWTWSQMRWSWANGSTSIDRKPAIYKKEVEIQNHTDHGKHLAKFPKSWFQIQAIFQAYQKCHS